MKWHKIWLLLALALFTQCISNGASASRDLKIQPLDRRQAAPARAYQGMYFDSYDMYVMPVELRQDRIRQQQKNVAAKWSLLRKTINDRKVPPRVRDDLHWVALGVARATGKPDSVALSMLDLAIYQDNVNRDLRYNMQGLVLAILALIASTLMLITPFVFCTNHYFEIKSAYDRLIVIGLVAALSVPIGLGFVFLIRVGAENIVSHQQNQGDALCQMLAIVTFATIALLVIFLRYMPLTRRLRPSFHFHRSMLVWLAKIPLLAWIIILLVPASPLVHSFLGFSEPLKISEQQAEVAYRGAVKASQRAFDRYLIPICLGDYSKFMSRLGHTLKAQTLEKMADASYQKIIQDKNYMQQVEALAAAKRQRQREAQATATPTKSTRSAGRIRSQHSARKWSFDGFGQRVLNLVGVITGSIAIVVVAAPELVVALFGYFKMNSLRDRSFTATVAYRKLLYGNNNPVLGDFLLLTGRLTQPFNTAQSQIYFQMGLDWYRTRLGAHERTAEALQLLGRTHLKNEDYPLALHLFEEALDMLDGSWTADRTCSLFVDISRAYIGLSKYLPARDFSSRALEVARQHVSAERERSNESFGLVGSEILAKSLLIMCLHDMAKTHIAFGRYADAQPFCEEALAVHDSVYKLVGRLDVMKTLLGIYEKRSDWAKADKLKKRIDKLEKLHPKSSAPVARMDGCLHPFSSPSAIIPRT